jgi:hypothetical protein
MDCGHSILLSVEEKNAITFGGADLYAPNGVSLTARRHGPGSCGPTHARNAGKQGFKQLKLGIGARVTPMPPPC